MIRYKRFMILLLSICPLFQLEATPPSLPGHLLNLASSYMPMTGNLPQYVLKSASHYWLGLFLGTTIAHELAHGCVGLLDGVPFQLCLGRQNTDPLIDSKYLKITKGIDLSDPGIAGQTEHFSRIRPPYRIPMLAAGPLCGMAFGGYILSKIWQADHAALLEAEETRMKILIICLSMLKTFYGMDIFASHFFNLLPISTSNKMTTDGYELLKEFKIPPSTLQRMSTISDNFTAKAIYIIPYGGAALAGISMAYALRQSNL